MFKQGKWNGKAAATLTLILSIMGGFEARAVEHSARKNMNIAEISKKVARAMLENLEKKDIDAWSKLWHEDGVQEMPFSPEGFPRKLEGKAALYNQYKSLPQNFSEMKFPIKRISTLEDPEWVVMEYDGLIKLKAGGEYNNKYISLLHIKNGKIALLREYFDPIILQSAFGMNLKNNFNVKEAK